MTSSIEYFLKMIDNYKFLDSEDKVFFFKLICGDFMKNERDLKTSKKFINILESELELMKFDYKIKKKRII